MADAPRTITSAAKLISRGELTPSDLLEECLARIDRCESRIHAWVHLDRQRARADAERLTAELKHGKSRGPLHGIPIGVKDVIDVFDMPTGCGSRLWVNCVARRDAACVKRLREAGAVILGKTVTTAYASFDPSITRNPWNLERTPGGSSSGSAAATACGMCLGALGTQTGGSITRPAAYCGVYSLKPSHGIVSVDGVLPLAPSLDHVGVMANCVRDLAILYQAIAGVDERSPTSGQAIPDAVHWIDRRLDPGTQQQAPIFGQMRDFFQDAAAETMREALTRFTTAIGDPNSNLVGEHRTTPETVLDLAMPASFARIHQHHRRIMAAEAAVYHRERLARRPEDYPPCITGLIEEGLRCSAIDYATARDQQSLARREMENMLKMPGAFLLTPATAGAAPGLETTGDPVMNSPWSFTGLPTVSLPIGWSDDGMPLAVQITGRGNSEGELLEAADRCERLAQFPRRETPL
jgi:aspartyl-tRNA(Asn)/glutamyl-tRNA(Gln) amidotransferase subunit A